MTILLQQARKWSCGEIISDSTGWPRGSLNGKTARNNCWAPTEYVCVQRQRQSGSGAGGQVTGSCEGQKLFLTLCNKCSLQSESCQRRISPPPLPLGVLFIFSFDLCLPAMKTLPSFYPCWFSLPSDFASLPKESSRAGLAFPDRGADPGRLSIKLQSISTRNHIPVRRQLRTAFSLFNTGPYLQWLVPYCDWHSLISTLPSGQCAWHFLGHFQAVGLLSCEVCNYISCTPDGSVTTFFIYRHHLVNLLKDSSNHWKKKSTERANEGINCF